MTMMPVLNKTVTEVLPARKVEASTAPIAESFDRELKDAGTRLDQPKPVDEPKPVATDAKKTEPKDKTVDSTEKTGHSQSDETVEEQDVPVASDETSESAQTSETTADADATTTDESVDTQIDPVTGGTNTEVVAEVIANTQIVEQLLVPVQTETTTAPTVTEQTPVQTQTVATTQTTEQATNQAVAQAVSVQTTGEQEAKPEVQVVQPQQQVKPENTQRVQAADQAEPTVSAERIAFVSESRQQDSRQATTDDSNQQLQTALKGDGKSQAATTTQTFSTTTTAASTTVNLASTVHAISSAETATQATTTTAQAAAPATQLQDSDTTEVNTARITRGIQNAVQQKGGSVTLRLTPPEMGTVRIQLQIQNGTVNAQFHAETESTRTLLHQQMSQLRTALEQQGLGVERLGVQTMQSSSTTMQHSFTQDQDTQADDGRSRGGFAHQGGRQGQRSDSAEQQQAFEQELTNAA